MTSRQLTSLGRTYMRRLGMVEWIPAADFRVMRGLTDADGTPLDGCTQWHAEERRCWIAVSPDTPERMTETLIHEILHVLLEGHLPAMGADKYDAGYELGLNRAAKAYMEAWNNE